MSNPYGSNDPYGQQSGNDPYGQPGQPGQPGQYGQGQYGQPGTDPQQQHDLYGQMTGYTSAGSSQSAPEADPYGSPVAASNPYESSPYGAYGDTTTATAPKSGLLGTLALIIGGLGVLLSLIMAIVGGNAYTTMVDQLGTTDIPDNPPAALQGEYATFGLTFMVYLFSGLPILAGLIMGIIAIATKRGRTFGIIATILGILGPIIVFVIFFLIAGPAAISNTPG
ncbi:hypothetical protein [Enemella sp. A6]|uniref:hypothetical protein n=1 Tax=Enemella sp. A6 TaxID=3440152 RepID=UPI003EBC08A3